MIVFQTNKYLLRVVLFFISIIFSVSITKAQISAPSHPETTGNQQLTTDQTDFFSPANRLKFGNYLYSEQDYLRALNEFREYLKTAENDTVRYKFADCFYRIGRYQEAAENFKGLFYNSFLSDDARLGFYECEFKSVDISAFRGLLGDENYMPEKYNNSILRLGLISHFFEDTVLPDTNKFFPVFPDSNKADIRKFYFMKKYPSKKNPTTAAILSAVIPGAGKIYTGEVGDGITAFIATGLLTYLSAANFQHDHKFRGWLFAGLAAFSYAGNIYGSAASAQIYNAGIKFNFDKEVKLYFDQRNYLLPARF